MRRPTVLLELDLWLHAIDSPAIAKELTRRSAHISHAIGVELGLRQAGRAGIPAPFVKLNVEAYVLAERDVHVLRDERVWTVRVTRPWDGLQTSNYDEFCSEVGSLLTEGISVAANSSDWAHADEVKSVVSNVVTQRPVCHYQMWSRDDPNASLRASLWYDSDESKASVVARIEDLHGTVLRTETLVEASTRPFDGLFPVRKITWESGILTARDARRQIIVQRQLTP